MVRQGFGVILVDSRACAKPPAMVTLGVQELQVVETAQEPRQIWVVPGVNHGTIYALAGDEYKRQVLGFFTRYLIP